MNQPVSADPEPSEDDLTDRRRTPSRSPGVMWAIPLTARRTIPAVSPTNTNFCNPSPDRRADAEGPAPVR